MIKFLYFTDVHAKGISPSTRTDDYPRTVDAKLKEVFQIGHENDVDAFLLGGDLFDTAFTSPGYIIHLGELMRVHLKGKHIYGIWGNHDMEAWNPNSIRKLSIGVFEAFANFFHILDRFPKRFTGKSGQTVRLSGVSSYPGMDRHVFDDDGNIIEHRSRDYIVKEEEDGLPRIHIVHGYLSPTAILDNIHHTVIEEMFETEATVTLTAHEHKGFPITKTSKGLVYNPGALTRVSASYSEMNRSPRVALITIHDDGTPEIEPIPLKTALPGSEVMDRSVIEEKNRKEAIISEVRGNMKEVLGSIELDEIDLSVIMENMRESVEPAVFEDVAKRLKINL